jgi:hypothetical protein
MDYQGAAFHRSSWRLDVPKNFELFSISSRYPRRIGFPRMYFVMFFFSALGNKSQEISRKKIIDVILGGFEQKYA